VINDAPPDKYQTTNQGEQIASWKGLQPSMRSTFAPKMEDWQIYLIAFGIFNLCLLIFCRQLSSVVLRFFAFGRTVCPPDVAERKAARMGFSGMFLDPETFRPSRKQATQFLAWSGGINFLGCVAFYIAIGSGLFSKQEGEQNASSNGGKRASLNSCFPLRRG